MKHQSSRDLFSHWERRRGGRAAPDRSEIDPGAIRHALGDVFILDTDGQSPAFRLAGTRLCALFDRELKGESFLDLWETTSARELRQLLRILAEEPGGVVGGASTLPPPSGRQASFEFLLLPLRHRNRFDLRLVGALSPLWTVPSFGAQARAPLVLQSYRHLLPQFFNWEQSNCPTPKPTRFQHGFAVYEGDKT